MTNAFNIDELILRVLDGVATPDEIQTLAQWLKTSPENEVYFNQLKKAWNLTSGPIPAKERVEYELGNYMKYIRSKHRKYSIGQLVKYAAIVMIPLLSVIYWLQLEKDEIPSQMAVGNPGIMPGPRADNRFITFSGKRYLCTGGSRGEKRTSWNCLPGFEKGCFYVTV